MRRNRWTWAGLFGLAMAALLLYLSHRYPSALAAEENRMRLVRGLVLLALVGGSVVLGWREHAGLALKQALGWAAIALVLVISYSYRQDFTALMTRVESEIVPSAPMERAYGVVSLRMDRSGHFRADAAVNGTHVRFLVDTGASDVVLAPFDARRLGFDLDKLDYVIPYSTANGRTYGAPVRLAEITVGSISVRNVRASVARDGLEQSLLGMGFLNRLSSFEMGGGRLILRQ